MYIQHFFEATCFSLKPKKYNGQVAKILRTDSGPSWLLGVDIVVVVVVRAAPDIPEMSVPGVGYSFKPKGLAFVTPLYPV